MEASGVPVEKPAIAAESGMTSGRRIAIVPYAVPVANEMTPAMTKMRAGTIHIGSESDRAPTR